MYRGPVSNDKYFGYSSATVPLKVLNAPFYWQSRTSFQGVETTEQLKWFHFMQTKTICRFEVAISISTMDRLTGRLTVLPWTNDMGGRSVGWSVMLIETGPRLCRYPDLVFLGVSSTVIAIIPLRT